MRLVFALALFATGAMLNVGPASAQTAKAYPFCATVSGFGTECNYENLSQCQQDINGMGGTCELNKSLIGKPGAYNSSGYGPEPQQPDQ
jgi:hypothetical protein